jgi:hypothetical protein
MLAPAMVAVLVGVLGQSPEATIPVVPTVPPPDEPQPSLLTPVQAPAPEPVPELVLQPADDGSGDLIHDGRGFRARVAPDGGVKFDDKQVTGVTPLPWLPQPVPYGVPSLQSTLRMALQGKPPPPAPAPDTSGPPPETTSVIPEVSRYRPDPRESCRTCTIDYLQPALVSALGRFDVGDEIARLNGEDPHRVEKARFLAATRDARVQMAATAHAQNVRQAMAELPARLDAIACDARLSTAQKHATLVALRDEMNTSAEGREAADRISTFLTRFEEGAPVCAREP